MEHIKTVTCQELFFHTHCHVFKNPLPAVQHPESERTKRLKMALEHLL